MNQEFIKYVERFIKLYNLDNNGRYKSYDHIRNAFLSYRKDETKIEHIALHLYAYLSSWGMLRNSFLMQKDYLFNKGIVDILCSNKYDSLIYYDPFIDDNSAEIKLIISLANEIKNYYIGKDYYKELSNSSTIINSVTDTLISKIILGTFGCIIAYDRYVKYALGSIKINQVINESSIKGIESLAKQYQEEIVACTNKLNKFYTPIKIVDMYLFEKGKELDKNKNNKGQKQYIIEIN